MNTAGIRMSKLQLIGFLSMFIAFSAKAWEVDFSRRQLEFSKVVDQRGPASLPNESKESLIDRALEPAEVGQDIVILNTENGFVPEKISLRQNATYQIHVANLNSKNKNISFILDAFSEQHNTIYGKVKTFTVTPKTDGVFSFVCPETAATGRMIVTPAPSLNKPVAQK